MFNLDFTRRVLITRAIAQLAEKALPDYTQLPPAVQLTPAEEAELHAEYLAHFSLPADPAFERTLLFVAGGPVTGKSTTVARLGLKNRFVHISGEDARAFLPHYAAIRFPPEDAVEGERVREAAQISREDAAYIRRNARLIMRPEVARRMDDALDHFLAADAPIMLEGQLFDPAHVLRQVAKARQAGYQVWLLQPDVNLRAMLEFAEARQRAEGKPFAVHTSLQQHRAQERNYGHLVHHFDQTLRFDNSAAQPRLVAYSSGNDFTIVDPTLYAESRFKRQINVDAPTPDKALDYAAFEKYAGMFGKVPAGMQDVPDSAARRAGHALLHLARLADTPLAPTRIPYPPRPDYGPA